MRFLSALPLFGAMLAIAACATSPVAPASPVPASEPATLAAEPATRTILISIDGFRADYLDRGATPTMSALASDGVRGAMRPSFPSKTFPNHYALITGLTPDHNGMINNTMEDPGKPGVLFKISDMFVASDPDWWEQGTPLWVSAEQQGVPTATMFWPGSDHVIHGSHPSMTIPFDQRLPDFARVDILLSWLDMPEETRPEFLTLYFDIVDTAGHMYGPESPKTVSATAQVDAAIARLLDGLEARGMLETTNIVIVADHGMAEVSDDQVISLEEKVSINDMHVVWTGAFAGLSPRPGHEEEVEAALLGRSEHGECWRKGELPERFAYGENPRVPEIICLADTGWRYETGMMRVWRGSGGDHGFDPDDPVMRAIFIANGPAFRAGVTLAPFDNVSVYPLLARLIGVEPVANDGDIADVAAALN